MKGEEGQDGFVDDLQDDTDFQNVGGDGDLSFRLLCRDIFSLFSL